MDLILLFTDGLHLSHLSAGSASAEHVEAREVNQRVVSWEDAVMLEGNFVHHLTQLRLAHVEIQVLIVRRRNVVHVCVAPTCSCTAMCSWCLHQLYLRLMFISDIQLRFFYVLTKHCFG